MLSALFASVTDTTVPGGDYVPGTPNKGFGSSIADVITTVSTAEKEALARSLGADEVIR